MANEKAMSVAIGMPHPLAVSPPALREKYIRAGTIMPNTAAPIGNMVLRTSASSPPINSRLSSRPTTKKNMDISPSLIQW